MKITQRLLERKFLIIAIVWTSLIAILCLISLNNVPSIPVKGKDKVVHFLFYFGYVIFWYKAFRNSKLFLVVISALFYGIIIEVLQPIITTTREADFYDVIANSLGAFSAMLFLNFMRKNNFSKNF